jgi:GntR family histidine utilization transcriptional repressor
MLERPEPHYLRLKRHIVSGIAAGRWNIEDKIPSEGELTRAFGLSRMTVNRALRELAQEGVIVREQGRGSFVARPKAAATMIAVRSIRDEIEARGARYEARLIESGERFANDMAAKRFELSPGARLFYSTVLHHADGLPLQIEERLVNPAVAPDYLRQDFNRIVPHDYLMQIAPLEAAEHVIEAELPDASCASRLSIRSSEPVLILSRRTWSQGTVASFVRLTHPASRYQFSGRIDTPPDASTPAASSSSDPKTEPI